ncbi:MAG: 5-oxoprolinase subunit PxpA [Acidobacteriota bacterium]
MKSIDLNCDMGESFGAWKMGNDAEIMGYISSANVACGFHAGDATTMRVTAEMALAKGVAVGAHPSYPDLQGFGRRTMSLTPDEVFDIVVYQVSALKGICESLGGRLSHVKPHGALYNQAAKDAIIARAIARAVQKCDDSLVVFGLSGSCSITEAGKFGLKTASEGFADRTYQRDGTLTPRSQPNALIPDQERAIDQVLQMVESQTVTAVDGATVGLTTDTICIHGDGPNALEFAAAINKALTTAGVSIRPV